ncbi:MAG: VPLPA-CTERM sorting domain-containing protein [Phycisphaerales bacterium]|nr:VPLPA-CTERM sorting domain-containing protein [Phycisphaerales bacterium]
MRYSALIPAAMACAVAGTVSAGAITTYTDRPSFNANAGGPLTLEDFTGTFHFPIATGVLNSQTNLPDIGILPGAIQPGVSYATPIGSGNFFNIDAGGAYEGGFLDGFEPSDRECTITFHQNDPNVARAVAEFGFDLGSLGSTDFDVRINFADGSSQLFNNIYPATLSFFGFQSDASDITSVVIGNDGGPLGFDFDNFTYTAVPAPAGIALLGFGGLAATRRRR